MFKNIDNQNIYLKTFHEFIIRFKDKRKNEIRNDIYGNILLIIKLILSKQKLIVIIIL